LKRRIERGGKKRSEDVLTPLHTTILSQLTRKGEDQTRHPSGGQEPRPEEGLVGVSLCFEGEEDVPGS
jgi:hypothetical protein